MIELSIIIPTRNRSFMLEKALRSIKIQNIDLRNLEVIVVDNDSSDDTREVCKQYEVYFPDFIYISEKKLGLHYGRHAGMLAANSNNLVFIDDDVKVCRDWAKTIINVFKNDDIVMMVGKILPDYVCEPVEWVEAIWEVDGNGKSIGFLSLLDFGDEPKSISPYYVYGCNLAIKKNVLIELGGFNPDGMPQELLKFRGDGETGLARKLIERGIAATYHPDACVYHLVNGQRMTYDYMYKRAFSQGISDSYTMIRNEGGITYKLTVVFLFKMFARWIRLSRKKKMRKYKDLKKSILLGYIKGLSYHKREVIKDKNLLQWVIKDNYMNDSG